MVHCVADAQPIGLLVTSGPPWVEVDQWVQIEGVVGIRARDGSRLLTIEASSVTPTNEPGDPYVHPTF